MKQLDEIVARLEATTGGRWHWAGNTDMGEPYLATWLPGHGRVVVMSIGSQERTMDDEHSERTRRDLRESGYDEDSIDDIVRGFVETAGGDPIEVPRLQFLGKDMMLINARDLPVFEVAPNATSRDDGAVYRADLAGIRHPDAEFIAHARDDVRRLSNALQELLRPHKPHEQWRMGYSGGQVCAECSHGDDMVPYPCYVVQDAEAALTADEA